MTYTLLSNNTGVRRDLDGAVIPQDPNNCDWTIYQKWLAAGNQPTSVPGTLNVPQIISDRQFAMQARNQGLITQAEAVAFVSSGTIPASLMAIVNQLPTQQMKDDAELFIAGANTYERASPITIEIGTAFAQSLNQTDANAFLDQFFIAAAAL